jgi:uncharacterized membrane protein (DUF2068 family)
MAGENVQSSKAADSPLSCAPPVHAHSRPRGAVLLWLIGAFKLFKGVLLVAAAISVFNLIGKDLGEVILEWSRRLHIAPGNRIVEHLLERALTVTNRQLVVLCIVLLLYAAMFTVEGVGLVLLKHWAEWMAVLTTSGLIPFEAYEIFRRPSWTKVVALAVNIAIVVYLFIHVRRENARLRLEEANSPPLNPS